MSSRCLYCDEIIPKQENRGEKYKKTYCNSSCAASANNLKGKHDTLFKEKHHLILQMMEEGLPTAIISKKLGVCRDTFLKRYPEYKDILKKSSFKKLSKSREEYYINKAKSKEERKEQIFEEIKLTGRCESDKQWSLQKKWLKLFLIERDGNKCSQCNWCEKNPVTGNIPVHIDHIDGNKENNHLSNVRILCPNCHSLTPTYGSIKRNRD
jgi:hypothetical protein